MIEDEGWRLLLLASEEMRSARMGLSAKVRIALMMMMYCILLSLPHHNPLAVLTRADRPPDRFDR